MFQAKSKQGLFTENDFALKIHLWKGFYASCNFPKSKISTDNKASTYKYFQAHFKS